MDIVIVPFHDYKKWQSEGFRTRDAHVCEHFSQDKRVNKILVINRPTSLAEILLKKAKWETPKGVVEYKNKNIQLSKMDKNVWCLDIFLDDFIKVAIQKKMWWYSAFNYDKVIEAINQAIDYLNMGDSILLLQNPMAIGITNKLSCKKFVFDAIDNWLYHPQMPDKNIIKKNYNYVEQNADLIMTVSEALTHTFSHNSNVHWIPNGVDINYFSRAIKDFRKTNKVIGYAGKIQDRVDFNLVEQCLINFPDEKFVFLGPVYAQSDAVNRLKRAYKNVEFKGDIHYAKLPDEMKEFDIAIIPHKIDSFTESMNPLKLYEYLASGKPVVTTGVAGAASISEYVYISKNESDFVKLLGTLIKEQDAITPNRIVESIPDECTWELRTNEMVDCIMEL